MFNKLSPPEKGVFLARCSGCAIKEIALVRCISNKTVEGHWAKAREKLKLNSVEQAIHYALHHKLIKNIYEVHILPNRNSC